MDVVWPFGAKKCPGWLVDLVKSLTSYGLV